MDMKEAMRMVMAVNLRNPNIFNSSETLNVKNEGSFKQR